MLFRHQEGASLAVKGVTVEVHVTGDCHLAITIRMIQLYFIAANLLRGYKICITNHQSECEDELQIRALIVVSNDELLVGQLLRIKLFYKREC